MEKTNNNIIEVGQIIFSNICNLTGPAIKENGLGDTITYGGDITESYLEKYKLDGILIAIKYLGDGLFEEMTTGEKIFTGEKGLTFFNDDNESCYNMVFSDRVNRYGRLSTEFSKADSKYNTELNYDDYLKNDQSETKLSKAEYVQKLNNIIINNIENPLLLDDVGTPLACVNDESKRAYLKHSDEERKKIIMEAKKMALIDTKEVNTKIAESIEKMKTISSDDLEMAYLDNQLFDFEQNGRTK